MNKKDLNNQALHWESKFTNKPEMFGSSPSAAALISAKMFKRENINNILELGAGQGRDCLFFAYDNRTIDDDNDDIVVNNVMLLLLGGRACVG